MQSIFIHTSSFSFKTATSAALTFYYLKYNFFLFPKCTSYLPSLFLISIILFLGWMTKLFLQTKSHPQIIPSLSLFFSHHIKHTFIAILSTSTFILILQWEPLGSQHQLHFPCWLLHASLLYILPIFTHFLHSFLKISKFIQSFTSHHPRGVRSYPGEPSRWPLP